MVIAIDIRIDTRKVKNLIKNISIKLPREVAEAGHDIAKTAEQLLKINLMRTSTRWRYKIFNGTKAERMSNNRSVVKIPIKGVRLDEMRPHPVWLKRGRLITQWANERGVKGFRMNKLSKKTGQDERGIFVKPHPWIQEPIVDAIGRVRRIVKRRVDKAMSEAQ